MTSGRLRIHDDLRAMLFGGIQLKQVTTVSRLGRKYPVKNESTADVSQYRER